MNKINFNKLNKLFQKEKISINISLFITGIIFFIFAIMKDNVDKNAYFLIPSGICFAIWMIITQGADKIDHLAFELTKFGVVITLLPSCLNFYLDSENFNGISFHLISFYVGIFFCIYYFVSKLNSTIHFTINIFKRIKMQLFKTTESSDKKSLQIIENITTFFVAIGGLTVAIKVIIEAMAQIIGYIK